MSVTFISSQVRLQSYLKDLSDFYLILQVNIISDNYDNLIPWFLDLGQTSPSSGEYLPFYRLSGFNLYEIGGQSSYLAYFSVTDNFPIISATNQTTNQILVNNYPQFTFDFSSIDTCRAGSEIYNDGLVSATQLYQISIVEVNKYAYGCVTYPGFICPTTLVRLANPRALNQLAQEMPGTVSIKQGKAIKYSLKASETNSGSGYILLVLFIVICALLLFGVCIFLLNKKH